MLNVLEFSDSVSDESEHRFLMRCATPTVKMEWKAAVTGLAEAAQAAVPRQRSGADRLLRSPRMSGTMDSIRGRTNTGQHDNNSSGTPLLSPRRTQQLVPVDTNWRNDSMPNVLPRSSDRVEPQWREKSLPLLRGSAVVEGSAIEYDATIEDDREATPPSRRTQTTSAVPHFVSGK